MNFLSSPFSKTTVSSYDETYFDKIDEIYRGDGTFEKETLYKLITYTTGIEQPSATTMSQLATKVGSTPITSSNIRDFGVGDKTVGNDVVVKFSGFEFMPTYVSRDKSGNVILTLWLADLTKLVGGKYDLTDSANPKIFDETVSATFNSGYERPSLLSPDYPTYPANMYGTSYMNCVVLNNGGGYVTAWSNKSLVESTKNKNHIFAPFTTNENITKFLVTPRSVSWQEKGQLGGSTILEDKLMYGNENWSLDLPDDGFYHTDSNYAHKEGSDNWADSTLWLPSYHETCRLWKLSSYQTSNGIGGYTWVRSKTQINSMNACAVNNDLGARVWASLVVRPALHLNLTKAFANVFVPKIEDFFSSNSNDPDIYYTANGNFYVKSFNGLKRFSEFMNLGGEFKSTIYLVNDIYCNGQTMVPIKNFYFNFDGQNHIIFDLNIVGTDYGGFIGIVQTGSIGKLMNVKFLNTQVSGETTGALFGIIRGNVSSASSFQIAENVFFEGSLQGTNVGGYVGEMDITSKNSAKLTLSFTDVAINVKTNASKIGLTTSLSNEFAAFNMTRSYAIINSQTTPSSTTICDSASLATTSSDFYACFTGSASLKKYYGNFTNSWYFNTKFNGGLPILKKFFHVGTSVSITGSQCLTQLRSLGFTSI